MGLKRSNLAAQAAAPADPRAELSSADADARRRAARLLESDPTAGDVLASRLSQESDPAVRDAILTSLLAIGGDAVAQSLAPLLRTGDAAVRNGALEVLERLPLPALRVLQPLLSDSDPDVRLFAVTALGLLREPVGAQAEASLVTVLEHEPHVNVCSAAIEAVRERGAIGAIDALDALAARFPDEPFIGFAAAATASELRAARSVS